MGSFPEQWLVIEPSHKTAFEFLYLLFADWLKIKIGTLSTQNTYFVVPENIHTPKMEIPIDFRTQEIPIPWGSKDILWNRTSQSHSLIATFGICIIIGFA